MKKMVLKLSIITLLCFCFCACSFSKSSVSNRDLQNYKTDYVGDATNVVGVVSNQNYPDGYSYDHIAIQSYEEPYGLTVFLKSSSTAKESDYEFNENANATFDLIGNLEKIQYIDVDTSTVLESFRRK